MGLIAKNEGMEFERLEDGVYTAVSQMLIDIGIFNHNGNKKVDEKNKENL